MASTIGISQYYSTNTCSSSDNCPEGVSPDFIIKRYDTSPSIKVALSDCDGIMDISDPDLVVEVNMWFKAKLKKNITSLETVIYFADNVGFDQLLIGDILYFDHPRSPEYMHVLSINEDTKAITVSRGQNSSNAISWKKGSLLYIYRVVSSQGFIESVYQDLIDVTGSTVTNQLVESNLIYNWKQNDTIVPGCYWLEFKLIKKTPEKSSVFYNFDSVLQYNVGSEPVLISPDLILASVDFNYKSSTFYLNSKSYNYDYFIISEDENLTIEIGEDNAGLITIVPTIYENETVSIIPILDEGISSVSIDILDVSEVSSIPSIQSGLEIKTLGNLKYKGQAIGDYAAGTNSFDLVINFNENATEEIVQYVLKRLSFINLSSAPGLWTRSLNYKLKDVDGNFSDSINFYIGMNSIPSVQKLEGVEWVRRFPACGEGFLVKVVNTVSREA